MTRSTNDKHRLEEEIDTLNDEIRRLNRRIRILEGENERLKFRGAVICKKTLDLAMALKIPFKDIMEYYHD